MCVVRVQWWQRKNAPQTKFQLAMAFNLIAISAGLPYLWNRVIDQKWEAFKAQKALEKEREAASDGSSGSSSFAGLNQAEILAVERTVNERRVALGKAPWPYDEIRAAEVTRQWKQGLKEALSMGFKTQQQDAALEKR